MEKGSLDYGDLTDLLLEQVRDKWQPRIDFARSLGYKRLEEYFLNELGADFVETRNQYSRVESARAAKGEVDSEGVAIFDEPASGDQNLAGYLS